ncbi:MAG: type I restriction-modification system subunit M [Christensenellaceae bacterium]|nr:type I restriction-modification system subunit M [Christensenellaceae bacterium]
MNNHEEQIKSLINSIRNICKANGLGGDANEYKIVTQSFLYKFLNDKFLYEVGKIKPSIKNYNDLKKLKENDYKLLMIEVANNSAHLKPEHLLEFLFTQQDQNDFDKTFDDTLNDIAISNNDIYSVHTGGNTDIRLFEEQLIGKSIDDKSKRQGVAKEIINALANAKFNFDDIFSAGFDFFSTLFEYMIKDYNKDGGGKYAEYYTPHSIAKVMAEILIGNDKPQDVTVYDPSAGSGTLLMNIASRIGTDKCTIYSQDISQKSTNLLRLNLILNNLSHSINNIIKDDTILHNHHTATTKMNYIVSNPPFEPQTSKKEWDDMKAVADLQRDRFPFGIPNLVTSKKVGTKTYIYLSFLQHIIYSLTDDGKAAVVVPQGFITASSGIGKSIRQLLVGKGWLKGVVSMPSNIFATTGTSVSVLFIDKTNVNGKVVLVDASKLGEERNDGENKKRYLSKADEQKIIDAFHKLQAIEDFSVVLDYEMIKNKHYSFSAGQYFDIKIEYSDITAKEFNNIITTRTNRLNGFFAENKKLENEIATQLKKLKFTGGGE